MKKLIALITCLACGLAHADEIGPRYETEEATAIEADTTAVPNDQAPKQVSKVDPETAPGKQSSYGKYLLAAGAIVVGIVALIFVNKNSGHH